MAVDYSTAVGKVRLLINDADPASEEQLFTDTEIETFLAIEDDSIKKAAAQALDTIADNEALVSKVIRSLDLSTNGAQLARELHARAKSLRDQADDEDEEGGFFQRVPFQPYGAPHIELTEYPLRYGGAPW